MSRDLRSRLLFLLEFLDFFLCFLESRDFDLDLDLLITDESSEILLFLCFRSFLFILVFWFFFDCNFFFGVGFMSGIWVFLSFCCFFDF